MKKKQEYTVFINDQDHSVFIECTDPRVTEYGLTFVNGNGMRCITNIPYFVREESASEKA